MATINEALQVRPSERQLRWQEMEYYGFIHFGVNTFTGREWGDGSESPSIFNPTRLDTEQWAKTAKDGGLTGLLITAKHHDGFCLWPSAHTEHSVKNAPYNQDIVGQLAKSCKKYGLKMGIYLSPWDRHDSRYGTEEYNDYFIAQLTELLTNYGEVFCVWFDGACGEGQNGKKQVYDWERYYKTIRQLQPGAVINICGPDVRWCGNEAGHCRKEEWSVVPEFLIDNEKIAGESQHADDGEFVDRVPSSTEDLGSRQQIEKARKLVWYPAEVDTSIRRGWFYHKEQDEQIKSLEKLMKIYLGSVGGNASLLLNLPPNKEGLIADGDVERIREMGQLLEEMYGSDCVSEAAMTEESADGMPVYRYSFDQKKKVNMVMLQEDIAKSQRVEEFIIEAKDGAGNSKVLFEGTCVGYKKICVFDEIEAEEINIIIKMARGKVFMKKIAIMHHPYVTKEIASQD